MQVPERTTNSDLRSPQAGPEARNDRHLVDTELAGCTNTRQITPGGVATLGRRTIEHWSSTQPNVTHSSGKAEFDGVVRESEQG